MALILNGTTGFDLPVPLAVSEGGTGGETLDSAGIVTKTGTQTLTNKTLSDPIFNIGGSQGSAGQVPVSQGTGLPPVWSNLPAGSEIVRVARISNTQLTSANKGNLIDITSGTFTQTFAAASVLGNGWFCYLKNSGTGNITLDPNASERIDGLTSYIMYPGEVRLVQCDGAAFRSLLIQGELLFIARHEVASGVAPETSSTSGVWKVRDLNTVVKNSIFSAALASNRITLPAGQYEVSATTPIFNGTTVKTKSRLYDITNSSVLIVGSNGASVSNSGDSSVLNGFFSLSATTDIELQSTDVGGQRGVAMSISGTPEVYSQIRIRKVA